MRQGRRRTHENIVQCKTQCTINETYYPICIAHYPYKYLYLHISAYKRM
jgi:hypothetical protein